MTSLIDIARAAAFAGLCSGCIVWSAAAFAAEPDALPHGVIVVHEADFSTPARVTRLKHKLDHVAKDICFGQAGEQGFFSRSERDCYDSAMNSGLMQIASRQQQATRGQAFNLADSAAHRSAE